MPATFVSSKEHKIFQTKRKCSHENTAQNSKTIKSLSPAKTLHTKTDRKKKKK
jgi:hypothetical protein